MNGKKSTRIKTFNVLRHGKFITVQQDPLEALYSRIRIMSSKPGGARFSYLQLKFPVEFKGDPAEVVEEFHKDFGNKGDFLQIVYCIEETATQTCCHCFHLLKESLSLMQGLFVSAISADWHRIFEVDQSQELVTPIPELKEYEPILVLLDQEMDKYTFIYVMNSCLGFAADYFALPIRTSTRPIRFGCTPLPKDDNDSIELPSTFASFLEDFGN